MKKQALWLLTAGTVCMSFGLLVSPFFKVPGSISDFLKGLGIILIFSALFVQKTKKGRCYGTTQDPIKNKT